MAAVKDLLSAVLVSAGDEEVFPVGAIVKEAGAMEDDVELSSSMGSVEEVGADSTSGKREVAAFVLDENPS